MVPAAVGRVRVEKQGTQRWLVAEAPPEVVQLAQRSAKLVGDGLYGIDIKDLESGPTVIEVNDNPNLDYGVEDKIMGNALYEKVLNAFVKRIESM